MTSGRRALAGAAFGALLTLLIHPLSRPFLIATGQGTPLHMVERCMDQPGVQPSPPQDLKGASQWVQMGLDRVYSTEGHLRPAEIDTLMGIIDSAVKAEPENAFWKQSKAVLFHAAGHPEEAKKLWIRAGNATYWRDYQSEWLFESRNHLANVIGTPQAWQLAYVYQKRQIGAADAIEKYARSLLGKASSDTPDGLEIRYATLMNGQLIRDGAQSKLVGSIGADLVDLTAYPANLAKEPSPRSLWTGQTEMLDKMAGFSGDWVGRSDRARSAFGDNEAWRALSGYVDAQNLPERYAYGSVATASVTGAIGLVGLLGLVLYGIGLLVHRKFSSLQHLSWPVVAVLALVLGVGGGILMNDAFAGLTTLVCTLFLRVSPPKRRSARPSDLGPLFNFLVLTISLLFTGYVAAYLVCRTVSAAAVLPGLGVPYEYYGTTMFLGLAAIPIGLLLLAVPMWSLAQRLPVPHVLGLALRRFGAFLSIGGLAACIILTPASVFADRKLSESLAQLVGNEPLFYYLRQ